MPYDQQILLQAAAIYYQSYVQSIVDSNPQKTYQLGYKNGFDEFTLDQSESALGVGYYYQDPVSEKNT